MTNLFVCIFIVTNFVQVPTEQADSKVEGGTNYIKLHRVIVAESKKPVVITNWVYVCSELVSSNSDFEWVAIRPNLLPPPLPTLPTNPRK